jgi:hypothetical protein
MDYDVSLSGHHQGYLITIQLVNDHIDRRGEEFIFYYLDIEHEGLASSSFVS